MGLFERYLSLWVALCIATGVGFGLARKAERAVQGAPMEVHRGIEAPRSLGVVQSERGYPPDALGAPRRPGSEAGPDQRTDRRLRISRTHQDTSFCIFKYDR